MTIVLLGDRDTTSITHRELDAAIGLLPDGVQAKWVGTDTSDARRTADADGLWVVPGSPYRNDAAVHAAITSARTSGQPFLGTCGGFQYAYADRLTGHGLVISARPDDAGVEAVELPTHPFFLATLFQPQIGSAARRTLHRVIQALVTAL